MTDYNDEPQRVRTQCPVCETWITFDEPVELWDQVDCPECMSLLEVIARRPLTLEVVEIDVGDDDDWDDMS